MFRSLLLLCLLLATACTRDAPGPVLLVYTENEPGGDPYPVRMLVTDQFLRIEDGDGKSGFILFDRSARKVYSVNNESRSTMVVSAGPVRMKAPKRFENRAEAVPETLPDVAGHPVVHYRLKTNDETCFNVYAADGLLPQAVSALREYHQTLAAEQQALQEAVPPAFQSACDIADYVLMPARHLDQGFPVRQINRSGITRQLTDFRTGVPVESKLFELPEGYQQIVPAEMREKR